MSDFEEIEKAFLKQIQAWKDMVTAPKVISGLPEIKQRIESLHARLETAQTAFSDLLAELNALPEIVRDTLGQTKAVLDQAAGTFLETAKELSHTLGERASEVLERTGQAANEELSEMQEFVSSEFLDKLVECYKTNVETVCEACSELRDDVEEQLEEYVETTKEQVTELTNKLDELGEEWKDAVSDLGGEYKELCEQIVTLGEDVTDLTEAIEAALDGTAVGMKAATSSIDDIKSIMAGIV